MTSPDIKLIVLDLDGTLLDDQKHVPSANIDAVRAAHAAGIHVALCSGRMLPNMENARQQLGLDLVLGGYNGAKVVDTLANQRQEVFHHPVSAERSVAIAETASARGWLVNLYCDDRLIAPPSPGSQRLIDIYQQRGGARYEFVELADLGQRPSTKLVVLAEPHEIPEVQRALATQLEGLSWVHSDPEYLEIMAPGVHKGAALQALAAHFGVGVDQCMALGDASNDREMVATAGLGVAMANASPDTKAAANVVMNFDNNQCAVARAIERYVL